MARKLLYAYMPLPFHSFVALCLCRLFGILDSIGFAYFPRVIRFASRVLAWRTGCTKFL